MTFTPKDAFITFNSAHADELARQHDKPWLQTALAYAMAQVAAHGASREEMAGIKRFSDTLVTLWEKPGEATTFPTRKLETFDDPSTVQPKR